MNVDEWLELANDMIVVRLPGLRAQPTIALRAWECETRIVRAYGVSEDAVLATFTHAGDRTKNDCVVRRYDVEDDELASFVADVETHLKSALRVEAVRSPLDDRG